MGNSRLAKPEHQKLGAIPSTLNPLSKAEVWDWISPRQSLLQGADVLTRPRVASEEVLATEPQIAVQTPFKALLCGPKASSMFMLRSIWEFPKIGDPNIVP